MNVDIIVCEKRESRSFGNWIRTHKKEILTGICLAAGTVLLSVSPAGIHEFIDP